MNYHSCDVLILTASFGNGHHSAMHALVEKIESLFPDMSVETEDLFNIASPKLKEYFTETYNILTKSNLPLYNSLYQLRNSRENVVDDLVLKLYFKRFEQYISRLNPKMIISVFPTCAQFANHYKRQRCYTLKTVTVITDVVAGWEWIHKDTDMYCAPTFDVKKELIDKGIRARNIFVTGVPVREAFEMPIVKQSSKKNVLIMASAMGKFSFTQHAIDALGQMPYGFTIVAGKDERLLTTLALLEIPNNVRVLGYTKEIPELMKNSDLIITKPGGATIFEAIESDLPLLIKSSRIGQEIFNEAFINKYGFGASFEGNHEMIEKIEALLSNDTYAQKIIENMNKFKAGIQRNEAYLQIIKMIKPIPADVSV